MNMGRPEHHSTDHMKKRGEEREVADNFPFKVDNNVCSTRPRFVSVLTATLGRLLKDGEVAEV